MSDLQTSAKPKSLAFRYLALAALGFVLGWGVTVKAMQGAQDAQAGRAQAVISQLLLKERAAELAGCRPQAIPMPLARPGIDWHFTADGKIP
jgi:hypothetical protein